MGLFLIGLLVVNTKCKLGTLTLFTQDCKFLLFNILKKIKMSWSCKVHDSKVKNLVGWLNFPQNTLCALIGITFSKYTESTQCNAFKSMADCLIVHYCQIPGCCKYTVCSMCLSCRRNSFHKDKAFWCKHIEYKEELKYLWINFIAF